MEEAASGEGGAGRAARRRLGRRLVLFPPPFQGHINPMLQLAALLHRTGFSVTVVHTRNNAPNPASFPDFSFVPIDDGTGEFAGSGDLIERAVAINDGCRGPFRDCMVRLLEEARQDGGEPLACLVADTFLYSIEAVAEELGVRRIVLRTSSAASFRLFNILPELREKGYYPIQDCRLQEEVPEAPPYRVKDLPRFDAGGDDGRMHEVMGRARRGMRTPAALVINTFEDLERDELASQQRDCAFPIFPVGPLSMLCRNASNSLLEEDRGCIEWLGRRRPRSVIYVSFGSLASMDREELEEVAWGLARSEQPFLWVLRPGSVRGAAAEEDLPRGFAEETRGRGVVVAWAPQLEVLAHPSVGGFWTHCGWNSLMESLCHGVPMLCRPYFGDQMGNSRYVGDVWKVGLVLDDAVLRRAAVETAVRRLMVEEEGVEMRKRAREMQRKAERCVEEGGSSHGSLRSLVDLILSWSP